MVVMTMVDEGSSLGEESWGRGTRTGGLSGGKTSRGLGEGEDILCVAANEDEEVSPGGWRGVPTELRSESGCRGGRDGGKTPWGRVGGA